MSAAVVAGGQEQHRDVDAVAAQPLGDRDPVQVREHDVEHHEIGPEVLDAGQCVTPVRGGCDLEALVAERGGHRVGDRGFVVHHQHSSRPMAATHPGTLLAPRISRCLFIDSFEDHRPTVAQPPEDSLRARFDGVASPVGRLPTGGPRPLDSPGPVGERP